MDTEAFCPTTHRVLTEGSTEIDAEVGFLGDGPVKMFAATYTPVDPPVVGMLICPPLHSEFLTNYRREVDLARRLAARGVAVTRFHYRGTGHSQDEDGPVTFESMRRDATEAATWSCERHGLDVLVVLGTRLSAMTAAAVAADRAGSPTAFWDPVIEGDRYFTEVFRLRRMSALSRGGSRLPRDGFAEMRDQGFADVFGYRIDRALFDSFRGRELGSALGEDARPVLLVQMDTRERLSEEYAAFADARTRSGSSVEVELVDGKEAWWFPGNQSQGPAKERSRMTVDATRDWLTRRILMGVPG